MTILDRIVEDNLDGLEERKRRVSVEELRSVIAGRPQPLDFAAALKGPGVSLIAEVKKASPSKGLIREDFQPVEIAGIYAANGASAISVLTEELYFQGHLNYLRDIADAPGERRVPLLRKDFIHDPYQVYEARACGADAVLLIVAILEFTKLKELYGLARELGMNCLVEVHDETELGIALESGAEVIGINNRDLKTFHVDIETTAGLRPLIPSDRVVVSESGIKGREDMVKMKEWGADAVLVGETLMASDDIPARMRELL